uniref:Uncharacterized protein n=1 Tax=Panagrolaimus sp. ES5 TaxID=591445 RepID=A0AC34GDN2_9BILA
AIADTFQQYYDNKDLKSNFSYVFYIYDEESAVDKYEGDYAKETKPGHAKVDFG